MLILFFVWKIPTDGKQVDLWYVIDARYFEYVILYFRYKNDSKGKRLERANKFIKMKNCNKWYRPLKSREAPLVVQK